MNIYHNPLNYLLGWAYVPTLGRKMENISPQQTINDIVQEMFPDAGMDDPASRDYSTPDESMFCINLLAAGTALGLSINYDHLELMLVPVITNVASWLYERYRGDDTKKHLAATNVHF